MEKSALTSSVLKSFASGVLSGTCSTLLFQPLDLVKTRIQTSINLGNGPAGIIAVVHNVVQQDKIIGLWRGLVPSISRCVPGIGIYFCSIHMLRSKFESPDPRPLQSIAIGATARSIAGITTLPFTVLKTRYENGVYGKTRMTRALVILYQTEGVRGLYCGLAATLLRDVPFSGIYFMFYTQLKKMASKKTPSHMSKEPVIHFVCGMMAGMLASIVTQPADVLKTHMQLYPQKYGRLKAAVLHVYVNDGLEGFWRGILPRTIRRTLMAAVSWTIYEEISKNMGLK